MTKKKKQEIDSLTEGMVYLKHEVFDALFSLVSDGVALFRALERGNDFALVAINEAGLKIAGLSKEEIYAIPLSEGYSRLGKQSLFEAIKRVYTSGESECVQYHAVNENGEKIWLDYCYTRLQDGLVLNVCHDISEKKRAEEEARTGEQRFYALFNDISDAVFIHALHADGTIGEFVDVNDAACRRLEYTREELLRLSPRDIDAGDLSVDREKAIKNIITKGHAVFSMVHISKLGRRIPVEINSHKVRFHDKDFIVSVARDMSDKIEAETRVKTSEEKYRENFENSPVSLWEEDFSGVWDYLTSLRENGVTDLHEYFHANPNTINELIKKIKIIDINHATVALHKASSKDELLHGLIKTFTEESRVMLAAEIVALWNRETDFTREGILKTFDGEILNVIVRWKVVPGYEDNYSKVIVSIIDITARKKAERLLESSEHRFRELINLAPDGVILGDREGRLIGANVKMELLSGYNMEEVKGKHIREFFSESELARVPFRFDLLNVGETVISERKFMRKDGSEFWVEMNSKKMPDGTYQSFIRDISERKQNEHEMTLFYEVANRMKTGMYVYHLEDIDNDRTLKMVSTNPAGTLGLGLRKEEILGKYIDEIFPRLRDNDIPKKFADVVRTGVSFRSEDYLYSDAAIKPGVFTFEAVALPGNYVCVLFDDITKQKEQDSEIQRNNDRLQSLVNILQKETTSIQTFLDTALNEVIVLTGSTIGYIYFYDEDTQEFELNTWSKEVMHECTVMNPQTKYMLDKTGVWGDAVRTRAPVILNDFTAPHPHKKGYPEGHVMLRNFLTVPVMHSGKIVAVVGVANKSSDYTQTDVLQLTLLMDSVWKTVEQLRTTQALRELSFRQEAILASVPDIIMEVDIARRYTWANDAGKEFFGDDVIGKEAADYFEGEQETYTTVAPLFDGDASLFYVESWQRRKDGQKRLLAWWCKALTDDNGVVKGALSTARDITEQKQLECELAESLERFKALHNASFGGIVIHDKGIILECNQGLSEMMGYSMEELIGMNGLLLIAPQDRDMVMGNIVAGYEKPYEADGLRKNGETFPMRLEARNIPYKGKNVRSVEFRDLTENKHAVESLRESEQKFRQTFDFSPVGSVIVGLDKKFIKCNKAFANFLQYTQDELIGKTIDEVTYQEDRDIGMNEMKSIINGAIEKAIVRKRYVTKDGTIVWGETSISLVRDIAENPLFFLPTIVDITEKKTAEDALKNKAKELEHFNKLMLGREYKMVELKREINELCEKAGLPPRYNLSFVHKEIVEDEERK